MNENVEPLEGGETAEGGNGKSRQRSTIGFPYTDYEAAAAVAQAIHGNVGHGTCSATGQLAAWMNQSPKSSGFRIQLAATRLFGLIESDDAESYRLTDLGRRVVDQAQTRSARAEAFLCVPLFRALFEKYKGGIVPPSAALEREIVALGVSEKQKARARQVFESSAEQTGFREQGANRLVLPAVVVTSSPPAKTKVTRGGGGNEGSGELDLDALLLALLHKIPSRDQEWPAENRLRWFRTFAMNVSQVYDDDNAPVEFEIEVKKKTS
jgi:hypothetical protein